MTPDADITILLQDARAGREGALDRLLPLVYEELRIIAQRHRRREPPNPTLNTTAIVHEAYLKVFGREPAALQDRSHFFAVACLAMRQVLRDGARRRLADRRGGGADHTSVTHHEPVVDPQIEMLLALDEAIDSLREAEPRLCEVVELRYFGGLTVAEVAQLLAVNERTVERDWRRARLYLAGILADRAPDEPPPGKPTA